MCGFAGCLGLRPDNDAIGKALKALSHRGPDGEGVFQAEDVTLLHTRLAILDLSVAGSQPMTDTDTGVTVAYNGEIYNFRDLRAGLSGPFHSDSDTEVLLRLYLRDGLAAVEQLRGMFAFAIWDPRDRSLHLVRDRVGIKPLYLWHDGPRAVFGSQPGALIALGVPPRLELSVARRYMEGGVLEEGRDTFFVGIKSVAPGTIVSFKDGRLSERRYWSLETAAARSRQELAGLRDPEEAVWNLLCESTRLHLVSDVPVGVCLSGGVDSQALIHTMWQAGVRGMHSFTFGFAEPEYDEAGMIAGERYPVEIERHVNRLSPDQMIGELRTAVARFEAPLGGLGTLSAFSLMRLARQRGVRVLLSGEGSDEVFGGYKYYFHAHLLGLLAEGREAEAIQEAEAWRALCGEDLRPGSPGLAALQNDSATMRAPDGTSLEGQDFLGPAFRDVAPVASSITIPHFVGDALRTAMGRDLLALKLPKLLMFQDRASMAHGVETRVPFLDHVLLEAVYGLPPSLLIKDGITKRLLKGVLRRFAQADFGRAVKMYVNAPQREWLKGSLFEPVRDILANGRLHAEGLLNLDAFDAAYTAYARAPGLGNSFFVWKMLNLELFLQEVLLNTHRPAT